MLVFFLTCLGVGRLRSRLYKQQKSRAKQSRAGEIFYISVIPISVWTALLCPAFHTTCQATLIGITLTLNNAPALLSPAFPLFVWTGPHTKSSSARSWQAGWQAVYTVIHWSPSTESRS